ncbi:hypothetical protein T439DRAFT_316102 [Meredithblackwellia eburnea MCA 4105]
MVPPPSTSGTPQRSGSLPLTSLNPSTEPLSQLTTRAGPEESLKSYRLLDALRSGDSARITPLLPSQPPAGSTTTDKKVSETGLVVDPNVAGTSTALHLAVRCSKTPTVDLVLRQCPYLLNTQDSRGQTPLHVASSLNRGDVVSLFLAQKEIDDSIKDSQGRTCLDVGANSDVASLISVSRAHYSEQYLTLLAHYVASPLPDGSSPSSNRLSTQLTSPKLGGSPLPGSKDGNSSSPHLPHLPNIPQLIRQHSYSSGSKSRQTSVSLSGPPAPPPPVASSTSTPSASADTTKPQVSAASGHVSNSAAEALYHFIVLPRSRAPVIDFGSKDGTSGTTVLHEAVKRKDLGIIKLVIAKGGDVLARDRKGKLAVDLAKDERVKSVLRQAATSEGRALKAAATSSGAGSTTDTSSAPQLGQPPAMKGYLSKWTNMARGYKPRWFVLERGVLSYYRSQEDEGKASRGSINMSVARVLPPGADKLKFEVTNKLGKSFPSFYLKGNHPVEVMRWVDVLRQNIDFAKENGNSVTRTTSGNSTYAPSIIEEKASSGPPSGGNGKRPSAGALNASHNPSLQSSPAHSFDDRDSIIGDDETFAGEDDLPPHAEDFDLLANGTKTQLELTQQLLDSLIVPSREGSVNLDRSMSSSSRPASIHSSTGRQADVKDALRGSLASLGGLLDEYIDVVGQRERFFVRKYEREIEAKRLWEDNLREVVASHAEMEVELQKASRDNTRRKKALQEVRANLATAASPALSPTSLAQATESAAAGADLAQLPEDGVTALPPPLSSSVSQTSVGVPAAPISPPLVSPPPSATVSGAGMIASPSTGSLSPGFRASGGRLRSATMRTLNPVELEQLVDSALGGESEDESEEEDDEFFEAIEQGTIPIAQDVSASGVVEHVEPAKDYLTNMDLEPYKGYEHLRDRLPITNDNRPPVSLWAILKGSIGKDLTKISFPVFFNEPTSMLQRMAEDVEFSECLDQAAADEDPKKRIAFVAAFAMSNYSSTIGRIAKPFNPMLGETFEYVDIKKKYRYISEQVSHHPPISACIAQSPAWEYYGEVDAKSKFLGKSFEIRPTGIAHVNLRIPKAWAPHLPPVPHIPDMVVEHYSWTKVITSVSNFLLGNPIIDHYGDMIVTNHRTGDKCTLTFKPRGWRGSGACEIKGKVVDAQGKEHWDIAGKWNSQLVARRHGMGDLAPDASVPTTGNGEVAPEYIRLWKNSVKPPGMPFNLTPFAVTLNDTNPELKKWLPPTDCRLRPDQHAFESGKFEVANQLKTDLEEHQRETRRKRERGELPPHTSRWFTRKKEKDTGELYWEPATASDGNLEYWEERTRVGKAKDKGEDAEWKDVDPIYADF